MVTVLTGLAVPLMVGVVLVDVDPFAGLEITKFKPEVSAVVGVAVGFPAAVVGAIVGVMVA